jgi:hypothetical protein
MSRRRDGHMVVPRGVSEQQGGYPSPPTPVSVLPKVPAGPAPGATAAATPRG